MSAVIEGKPCVPSRQPSETISYTPFFGKYATTGRSEGAFGENGAGEFGNCAHRTAPRSPSNRGVERHAWRVSPPRPAPAGPPAPRRQRRPARLLRTRGSPTPAVRARDPAVLELLLRPRVGSL